MNPISVVWNTLVVFFDLMVHPRKLKAALINPEVQAVYHLSSMITFVGLFMSSLAYPAWARELAIQSKQAVAAGYAWLTDGAGGDALKAVWEVLREFIWS
jgi:hypothetical protein